MTYPNGKTVKYTMGRGTVPCPTKKTNGTRNRPLSHKLPRF